MLLGTERISELIRSVTGQYEDTFQDAWVRVMDDHVATEEDVLRIAREVSHEHASKVIGDKYKVKSLEAPLKEDEGDFTLESIIPSPPLMPDDESYRVLGSPSTKNKVVLDSEVVSKLRERFGTLPFNHCIRSLLGLPPLERLEAWQVWEDTIIKERYPWGGSLAVKTDVSRTGGAIRTRAMKIGVKFDQLRPHEDWITAREAEQELHYHRAHIRQLVHKGLLKAIAIEGLHSYTRLFFTKSDIEDFKSRLPIIEAERILKRKQIAKMCNKQPFRVVWVGEKTHYLYRVDEDGDYYTYCQKSHSRRGKVHTYFPKRTINMMTLARGNPTCKKCLYALRKFREVN